MRYGYHYTPCATGASGPGLWLLLKLAVLAAIGAGVWWVLQAIGRATAAAVGAVSGAAAAAGPVMVVALAAVGVMVALGVMTLVVRNNQRPPMVPHDRPARRALGTSTVEVIDVTPNRRPLDRPRPVYQPLAARRPAKVPQMVR